jgi:hypothetical protein
MLKKFAAALLVSAVAALSDVPGVLAPATAQVAYGWHFAGAYRSYEAACQKAYQLEACGYCACIKKQSYAYCVYYK